MISIVGLLVGIIVPSYYQVINNRKANIPLGGLLAKPIVNIVYEVTVVDSNTNTVVAIPYDKYYIKGTLNRVLLQVNTNVCHPGVHFVRSEDGQDHLVVPFTNFHIKGWVEDFSGSL